MAIPGDIHWEEGLFLQPHHLQLLQQQTINRVVQERRLLRGYPYGVIEAQISHDELRNMLVRFDRLRAIMPSGVLVDVPGNAGPPPFDISKAFEAGDGPLSVSLGVPYWYAQRANAIESNDGADSRAKRIYRISECEAADENTGENPQPIRIRHVNARFLLNDDDQTDLEVLPLMRVLHGTGEQVGLPLIDPDFIPPCFVIHGSGALTKMARDIANAVDASRRVAVDRMIQSGFNMETMRGAQFGQLLRLQTLSRYGARLTHLVESDATTPFQLCLEWRGLLGELSALQPRPEMLDVPSYDHDEPSNVFVDLAERIRRELVPVEPPSILKVDFVREASVFIARLTDEQVTRPIAYFLGIRSKQDPGGLAELVQDADKFKLMPESMTGRAVHGVALIEERHPPLQLPAEVGLSYFRLARDDSPRTWERVQQDRALTAQWPNSEVAEEKLTLYMTVEPGGIGQ